MFVVFFSGIGLQCVTDLRGQTLITFFLWHVHSSYLFLQHRAATDAHLHA